MLESPFSEEDFPQILSKSPLEQFGATCSYPIACYFGRDTFLLDISTQLKQLSGFTTSTLVCPKDCLCICLYILTWRPEVWTSLWRRPTDYKSLHGPAGRDDISCLEVWKVLWKVAGCIWTISGCHWKWTLIPCFWEDYFDSKSAYFFKIRDLRLLLCI